MLNENDARLLQIAAEEFLSAVTRYIKKARARAKTKEAKKLLGELLDQCRSGLTMTFKAKGP